MKIVHFLISFISYLSCQKERRDNLNMPEPILLTIPLTHVNRDKTRSGKIEVEENPYDILEKGCIVLPYNRNLTML